jgi:iron complex transport system substrate-binding protein
VKSDQVSVTTREPRIVSLLPSATEIVCALGLEQDLVGVTHECDYPPSVRGKPVLTRSVLNGTTESHDIDRHIRALVHRGSSIYHLDGERLQELQPDLILTQELCRVCAVSYPIVEQAVRRADGEPQIVSLEPESLADVYGTIETVGRLTGRVDQAQRVVAGLRDRVDAVRSAVAGPPPREVVCLEWIDPPFSCGHWTPELVGLAGGRELLGTGRRPAQMVSLETVATAKPEVVVVMACGFGLERSLDELDRLSGALDDIGDQLWVVDGNAYFSRPGPRLVDSLEILAGILHPGAVATPRPDAAQRLH